MINYTKTNQMVLVLFCFSPGLFSSFQQSSQPLLIQSYSFVSLFPISSQLCQYQTNSPIQCQQRIQNKLNTVYKIGPSTFKYVKTDWKKIIKKELRVPWKTKKLEKKIFTFCSHTRSWNIWSAHLSQ